LSETEKDWTAVEQAGTLAPAPKKAAGGKGGKGTSRSKNKEKNGKKDEKDKGECKSQSDIEKDDKDNDRRVERVIFVDAEQGDFIMQGVDSPALSQDRTWGKFGEVPGGSGLERRGMVLQNYVEIERAPFGSRPFGLEQIMAATGAFA